VSSPAAAVDGSPGHVTFGFANRTGVPAQLTRVGRVRGRRPGRL